jgi:hypothetical protein
MAIAVTREREIEDSCADRARSRPLSVMAVGKLDARSGNHGIRK